MIGKVIGALAGKKVAERYGDSSAKGAILGAAAAGAARRLGPVGLLLVGGFATKRLLDRRRAQRQMPPSA